MFGKRYKLFTIFGFEVGVDASWLIIAALITWSLAVGFFPQSYPGLTGVAYWTMGVVGALGLFASILFHEFCHSIVARRLGLPMKGITLFLFGGVAEMNEEPASAKVEFLMAAAGPAASIALGFVFWLAARYGQALWQPQVQGVVEYLAYINWLLAAFNLLPAFPLDGGRILRSILWRWKKDLTWATRMAAQTGGAFGLLLIGLGLLSMFTGNLIGGLWYFVIGMFLRSAAQGSYRQVVWRQALKGTKVRELMQPAVTVSSGETLENLVHDYVYRHHYKMFPVVDDGRLVGCITTRQVKGVPREEWPQRIVGQVATSCGLDNTIDPEAEVSQAFAKMTGSGNSRLMVTSGDQLLGVVALKDISGFISAYMDLEGGGE